MKPEEIKELVASHQPDAIEIDSKVNLVLIQDIDLPKILRVNIDTDNLPALFASAAPYVSHFLLTGDSPESLQGMESSIEIWAAQYPIILGLEVPEEDLEEWVDQTSIQAVSYTHLRAHETLSDLVCRLQSVSYTHLTLPTNREV